MRIEWEQQNTNLMKKIEDIVFDIGEDNKRTYPSYYRGGGCSSSYSPEGYNVNQVVFMWERDLGTYITCMIDSVDRTSNPAIYKILPLEPYSTQVCWTHKNVSAASLYNANEMAAMNRWD
jgi:hypothetical protein